MKYQLVLQFPADSTVDFDEMIALEDTLIQKLGSSALVDGHDCGSGQMNIFVHTDKPKETFEKLQPILADRKKLKDFVAAFRELRGDEYTVLWPQALETPFRIA